MNDGHKVHMEAQERKWIGDYKYEDTGVLGKKKEEELLREAIADDLVRVVLMQLSSVQ